MKNGRAAKKAADDRCVHIRARRTPLSAHSIPSAHAPLSTRAPSAYSHPRACGRKAAEIWAKHKRADLDAKAEAKLKLKAKEAHKALADAKKTQAEANKFLAGRSIS